MNFVCDIPNSWSLQCWNESRLVYGCGRQSGNILFLYGKEYIYIYTFCYARPPRNEQRRKRTQNGMTAKACYKASGERVFFFLLLKIYKFCCLRARSSTPPVPSQKKPTVLQSIRRDCRYHRSIKRNYNLYIVIILQDSDEWIDFVMWPCKSNCSGKIGKTGSWMEPTGTAACRAQPVLFRFNCEKKEKRSLYRLELARQYNIISPTNINPWYI